MVTIKLLAHDKESQMRFELYRLAPGTKLPAHQHSDFEYIYVLQGELRDEFGRYAQGSFKINSKSSVHASYSPKGCTLLVIGRGKHRPINQSHEKDSVKNKK